MSLCESPRSCSTVEWFASEVRSDNQQSLVIGFLEPKTLGRTSDANIVVDSLVVSKVHARLGLDEQNRPFVEDLKSTNGTFVNNNRVESAVLAEGDLIRLANVTFEIQCKSLSPLEEPSEEPAEAPSAAELAPSTAERASNSITWTAALLQFEELMMPGGVKPYCQPIVKVSDGSLIGYECLARSGLENLAKPDEMFDAASQLNHETELSELMRRSSIEAFSNQQRPGVIFLNSHPDEGFGFRFETSLRELRKAAPDLEIAIELQEEVVCDTEGMAKFRALLNELDMRLVYDDFGADQERLNQLVEMPPDYLKFDISMIRGIDTSTENHRALVGALVQAVHGMGIISVAEGVETEAEAQACRELGFQLAQGYFYGRPEPIVAQQPAQEEIQAE